MKKLFLFIVFILLLGVIAVLSLRLFTNEDTWLCINGQWVKHGNPSASMPTTGCGSSDNTVTSSSTPNLLADKIKVDSPAPNSQVASPLIVTGQARGSWYFEASFPVKLLDGNGKEIAAIPAQAQGDWMTDNFVSFRAELSFTPPATATGTLVLERDNPSGLPQNAAQITIPVIFTSVKKTSVRVYFGNSKINPNAEDCSGVYPVVRMVAPTEAIARAAIEELLKGVTPEEKDQGFFTSINPGVTINRLVINNGVAEIDLSPKLDEAVGGSCRVANIRAQITETLKQFSTVKAVTISINGRTADILQP